MKLEPLRADATTTTHRESDSNHRVPPCDPQLISSARQRPFPHLTRSVRRAGGFVLTGDAEVTELLPSSRRLPGGAYGSSQTWARLEHPQDRHRRIIRLKASREIVHGVEDQPDDIFSVLNAASSCRFQQTLKSPLLAVPVYRFNDAIGVGDHQIPWAKVHDALFVIRIREHSNRCTTPFQPLDCAVGSKNQRRIVTRIHVV